NPRRDCSVRSLTCPDSHLLTFLHRHARHYHSSPTRRSSDLCDSGYSCAYSCNISWRTESTPNASEINPRLVFERLFSNGVKGEADRKSTRLNSSHDQISYAVFCLKKTSGTRPSRSARRAERH